MGVNIREKKIEKQQITFIRSLLEGKIEISNKEAKERIQYLNLNGLVPRFVVLNIAPNYSNVSYDKKDAVIYELEENVRRWLKKAKIYNFCFTNGYNNLSVLLSLDNSDLTIKDIDIVCIEIHNKIYKEYQLDSFIGIGSIANTYQEIHVSASDAHEMLSYKYQYADQGVINIANLVKFQFNISLENRSSFDRVIGCFQDGNLGKMSRRLDELVEQIRNRPNVSNTSIKRTMIEVVVHILHVASLANIDVDDVLGDVEPYRWIMKQDSTEVITEWIMKISSELLARINEEKKYSARKAIQQAQIFIEEKLMDSELSLQKISEKVGLSNSYFSQLFKKETGNGINAYIVQQRIFRAQILLKETRLKCEDIAKQTGFSSSGYFVQVFKKNVGTTPGQFRKEHENEKN